LNIHRGNDIVRCILDPILESVLEVLDVISDIWDLYRSEVIFRHSREDFELMYEVKKRVVYWRCCQIENRLAFGHFLKAPPSRFWRRGVIALGSPVPKVMSLIDDDDVDALS
jgi:Mg2+ and Co2+ transporter CorA